MKKYFLIFILLTAGSVYSQSQIITHTIFWEISKPGIKYKSYLLGTDHIMGPSFFNSLTCAKEKMALSKILYVEQILTKGMSMDPNALQRIRDTVQWDKTWNTQKWYSLLKPDQKKVFLDFEKQTGNAAMTDYLYRQTPGQLSTLLSILYYQNVCDIVIPLQADSLMDFYIAETATKENIQVTGLDKNLDYEVTARKKDSLDGFHENIKSCLGFMKKMLHTDSSGCSIQWNYQKLQADYGFKEQNHKNQIILNNRNKAWMKILPGAFDAAPCFVAVGLAHLFYTTGLIQSLRRMGYKVEPLAAK